MANITNEALQSVSEKLKTFTEGLSDEERTVVQLLIEEATTPDDEVSGFDFSSFTAVPTSFTFSPAKLDARISTRFGKGSSDDGHTGYWSLDIGSGGSAIGGTRI